MIKKLIALFAFGMFLAVSPLPTHAGGPCGNFMRPTYRAVDKTRFLSHAPPSTIGGHFILADWTGDGRLDFYNFRFNSSTGKQDVIIYAALATGYWDWNNAIVIPTTFTTATTDRTQTTFHRVFDFDSDGDMDLVQRTGTGANHETHVFINNGTSLGPDVTTSWPSGAGTLTHEIGYHDVNNDGKLDFVYLRVDGGSEGPQSMYYAPGNADGSFGSAVLIIANNSTNEFNNTSRVVGDFNGDGKLDFSYAKFSGSTGTMRTLTNMGNGSFELEDPQSTASFTPVGAFDIDQDGKADMVGIDSTSFFILYGSADSTFTQVTYPYSIPGITVRFRDIDMNGDGRNDIVVWGSTNYEVFLRNTDRTFTSQSYPWNVDNFQQFFMQIGDFNADGKDDFFDEYPGARPYNLFGEEVLVVKTNSCTPGVAPKFHNFDGNHRSDIVTWNAANGQWRRGDANFNSSSSIPTTTFQWGLGSLGDVPAPGDFDGDGKTDYTVFRNGEGQWYTFLSSSSSWAVFPFGAPGDIPIPNDYNGGGKTDYAVFRPSEGVWYILFSETGQYAIHQWGTNGDRPVPADYDGDGRSDLGVFRPSDGVWYYIRSSDSSFGIAQWGLGTDIPVPADYDGDGMADLAVYRSGTWYIYRSHNNAVAILSWGAPTDLPIPVGQLGDISFPTVFRPSDTKWYRFGLGIGYAVPVAGTPVYYGLPNN